MLVLIDESGCPGFKLTKGSTPYFIIGMVCFTDFKEAEKVSRIIAELQTTLGLKDEFKFNKTHPNVKEKFFQTVCQHDFKVRALVVNKKNIYSPYLRTEKESFYNYFIKQLIPTLIYPLIKKIGFMFDRNTLIWTFLSKGSPSWRWRSSELII